MIPLKEDKHYIENEDDTKEFLQERRSLASFTYNPNSRYSESFVLEKINADTRVVLRFSEAFLV